MSESEASRGRLSMEEVFRIHRERTAAERSERELLVRLQRVQKNIKRIEALDREVRVVTDSSKAKEFSDRHNDPRVNIQEKVVLAGLSGNPDELHELEKSVQLGGGFLEIYTNELEEKRLENSVALRNDGSGWFMIETVGRPVNPKDLSVGEPMVGGDLQLWVPPDRSDIALEPSIGFEATDVVISNAETIVDQIRQNPAIAAWISDVCALERNMGFASFAEDKGFDLIEELNATRQNKVQYALAAMGEIVALLNERDEPIRDFNPTLINIATIILHCRRLARPGLLLGVQQNRKVPVRLPGGGKGSLLMKWNVAAQRTRKLQTQ